MRNEKVLEMLNEGKLEDLKAALQDEIYAETLKNKPDAKKRYSAMKKYFKLTNSAREACQKPCSIIFEDKDYNAFTNSYSLALTTESCGEIKMFDTENGNYPDISRLIDFTGTEGTIDFKKVIAEAKSKGYKLKKSEMMSNKYLMHYNGAYFRISLIDSTYGIIADGKPAYVYHGEGSRGKLTIKNDIGICVIIPLFIGEKLDEGSIVIEV